MSYIVRGAFTELTLKPDSVVESVIQNVCVIVSTIRGEVPLDRGFGLAGRFLDKPMSAAKAILITELLEALSAYEPRAKLVSADFDIDPITPGKLIPIVEVEIDE